MNKWPEILQMGLYRAFTTGFIFLEQKFMLAIQALESLMVS